MFEIYEYLKKIFKEVPQVPRKSEINENVPYNPEFKEAWVARRSYTYITSPHPIHEVGDLVVANWGSTIHKQNVKTVDEVEDLIIEFSRK